MSSYDGGLGGTFALLILLFFWGIWILGNTALYAIYTDQSGNTTEGFFLVYAICSVLIGLYLLANWRSSEDIDKAKKNLSEKKTQLHKLKEQKTSLLSE